MLCSCLFAGSHLWMNFVIVHLWPYSRFVKGSSMGEPVDMVAGVTFPIVGLVHVVPEFWGCCCSTDIILCRTVDRFISYSEGGWVALRKLWRVLGSKSIFMSFHCFPLSSSEELLDVLRSFAFSSCHGDLFRLIFGWEGRAMKADILPKIQCFDHVHKRSVQIVVFQGMPWGSVLEDFLDSVSQMRVREMEVEGFENRPLAKFCDSGYTSNSTDHGCAEIAPCCFGGGSEL